MGYNTVAFMLNDRACELEKRDDVGAFLCRCMRSGDGGNIGQMIEVLPSQHADTQQVIVAGGNRITRLGYCWGLSHNPEDILQQLAEQHGYKLVKVKP